MPEQPYADQDAERVAHGVRLGGRGQELEAVLGSATGPMTVADLERILRPDLSDDESDPAGRNMERTGMCLISRNGGSYGLAARWFGWLPGHYETREAALVAYGYVLGGEGAGYLDQVAKPGPTPWTVEMLEEFAGE